ncbi:MAG: hypothetical protein ACYC8T_29910, partial [Myxococcaceae bacterium]
PAGWESPSFDDSSWMPAVVEDQVGTAQIWGTAPAMMPPGSTAKWIWSFDSRGTDDSSTVYFRRAFVAPNGQLVVRMAADDSFITYLDGMQVGMASSWVNATVIPLATTPGAGYVLAVRAVNIGSSGGVVADLRTAQKTCRPTVLVPDAGHVDAGVGILHAVDHAILDEEFPNYVHAGRLHIRDDARSCGGLGAARFRYTRSTAHGPARRRRGTTPRSSTARPGVP